MIVEFSKAVSLLLSLCLVQGFIARFSRRHELLGQSFSGVLYGVICVVGMATPVTVAPGVIFDARSVVLSLAGLFGGPIVGGIAGAMAGGYRAWLGGGGAPVGVSVIVSCVMLGLVYRVLHQRGAVRIAIPELLAFGLIVHLVEIYLFTFLPDTVVGDVMSAVAIPILLTFTPATAVLGYLLLIIGRQADTEHALAESERRFKDIADAASDWFWEMDEDLRFTYLSDRLHEVTGIMPNDILGKSRTEIAEPVRLPEDIVRWDAHLADLRAHKPFKDFTYSMRDHDGQSRYFSISGAPVFDQMGTFRGYRGVATDITQRMAAESELHRLASIIETTEDAVVLQSSEGTITYWNAAAERIFGYSAEEALGQASLILAPTESDEKSGHLSEAFLSGHRWGSFDSIGCRKDGTPIDLSVTMTAIPDQHGVATATAAIIRDMSELQQTRKQLFQAQKMEATGRIAGGIAHDFNNLLAVVMGNAELIADADDPGEVRCLASEIVRAAERGAELTRRLLSFARKSHLAPETVNPNTVVAGMSDLFNRVLPASIEFDMRLAQDLRDTQVDVSFLESALLNIVINARDAMPEGGRIFIETANAQLTPEEAETFPEDMVPGDYVSIIVRDTGIGIPHEDITKVIEPFFTTKGPDKGSGLGLAMVHGFARQSSGALRIASVAGEGTSITLLLPALSDDAADLPSKGSAERQRVREHEGTVLIVDDEIAILNMLERTLISVGFSVLRAENGDQAIRDFVGAADTIDVLLTDIVMPGTAQGPGVAVAFTQRSSRIQPVFMSGYPRDSEIGNAELGTGWRFLTKPVRRDDLVDAVGAAARAARSQPPEKRTVGS